MLPSQGFLPVIYTWLRARRPSASVQLPTDDPDTEELPQIQNKLAPQQLTGWKVLLLWIPAACDLTGTTVSSRPPPLMLALTLNVFFYQLMNVGLLYTPVSIYQMTRGALVLFVGTLSVVFLRRKLWLYKFSRPCSLFILYK